MQKVLMSVALLAMLAVTAMAKPGDQWILPIDHTNGGGFTTLPGAGYNGSDALDASGPDGVRRVIWALNNAGIPATTELYTIEFFACTAGGTDWQPIESQMRAVDGETYPIEPLIPWAGEYGTNHQYMAAASNHSGTWLPNGPGPHSPESAAFNALGDNGIYMWLRAGAWLYAKWDFPFPIHRAWSALRITQITTPGACCLPDASCRDDMSPAACTALSGTQQGLNSTCAQLQCPEATGACCLPSSSVCAEITGSACTLRGGVFHGYNTTCADKWPTCCHDPFADADGDGDVDQEDFAAFQACYTGTGGSYSGATCGCMDVNRDTAIDGDDRAAFERCASGPGIPTDASCDNVLPPP